MAKEVMEVFPKTPTMAFGTTKKEMAHQRKVLAMEILTASVFDKKVNCAMCAGIKPPGSVPHHTHTDWAVWVLTKNNKAFATSEVFKECMVAVLEELATDKSMDRIVASVKQVPLSASTTARRVHVLAEDVQRLVLDEVKKAEHISVAIDESTDTTDISQLSVFVRYFDGKDFKEELLTLIPLEDGAPAMVGKNRGMVSRFKNVAPKTNALHCLIHQSVLCAKLSGDLKDVMDKTMKIINFIRGNSSTQHRLFRKFVLESDATHDDLLLHNDVRWLSKVGEFSANAKKLLQLAEAAIQIQLIDMQASSEMQAALR
ncbi:hypothetical protein JOQ06_027888, partial [Pogonophryne albipinna]